MASRTVEIRSLTFFAAAHVATLIVAVLQSTGTAEACQRQVTRVIDGYWATVTVPCGDDPWDLSDPGGSGFLDGWIYDADGNRIAGDAPKPGTVQYLDTDGNRGYRGVYVGDRVPTPVVGANNELVRYVMREIAVSYGQILSSGERFISTPQRSAASPDDNDEVVYTANSNHRAVRGTDGHCYREERLSGRWQRSGSYGTDDDACRNASWNAYLRSLGDPPINPDGETFPSGAPPVVGVLQTLVSNIGQPNGQLGFARYDHSQGFTTGSHAKGYRLTEVRINVAGVVGTNWEVELWSLDGTYRVQRLATLNKPTSISNEAGILTFTLPGPGYDLEASTRYAVVIDSKSGGEGLKPRNTASNVEDPGASHGWSIDTSSDFRTCGTCSWSAFNEVRMISIIGIPK